MQDNYPEVKEKMQLPISKLESIITEAWDSIIPKELGRLIASVTTIYQAIIESRGALTSYLSLFKLKLHHTY